jgi:hypothetical protein
VAAVHDDRTYSTDARTKTGAGAWPGIVAAEHCGSKIRVVGLVSLLADRPGLRADAGLSDTQALSRSLRLES